MNTGIRRYVRVATENLAFFGVIAVLFAFGFYQGLQQYVLRLDLVFVLIQILLLNAVMATFFFSGFLLVSAGLYWWRLSRPVPPGETTGPDCVAVVPAYRETQQTLRRAVTALTNSTYEPLSVMIACQNDDAETHAVAEELANEYDAVDFVVNRDGPQSKPGNVNHAVAQTSAPVIAVFDADSEPHRRFLSAAVATLKDVDVVQGRLVSKPSGLIETIAYYEDLIISALSRQLLYLLTSFRLALSNGTVMTRDAFETVGGYDNVLADDYDFAFTCYRAGIDVALLPSFPVLREPAHTLRDWWGQRKRWIASYLQVFYRLLTGFRRFNLFRTLVSLVIAGSSVIGGVFLVLLLSKFVLLLVFNVEQIYVWPALLLILVSGLFHYRDYRNGFVARPGPALLVVPFIIPAFALVSIRSLLSLTPVWRRDWYQARRR